MFVLDEDFLEEYFYLVEAGFVLEEKDTGIPQQLKSLGEIKEAKSSYTQSSEQSDTV